MAKKLIYKVGTYYKTFDGSKVICERVFLTGEFVAEFGNNEGAYLVERDSKNIEPWTPVSEWKE